MEFSLFDRDNFWAVFAVAAAIIGVCDGIFLFIATRSGLYNALTPQKGWYVYMGIYVLLAGAIVASFNGPAVLGFVLGFVIFAVYDITTLATTELDFFSAIIDVLYGTLVYGLAFSIVSQL